jgi:integrase
MTVSTETPATVTAVKRNEPERTLFTKAKLNELLRNRPHRQKIIWDTEEVGLSVLVSRGPKHRRQATVTFRVVYYLKGKPGVPRYKVLGRYPDECSDIGAMRDAARQTRNDAKAGIDPKRPRLSGNFANVAERFINEHAKQNRTWEETKRILDLYVVPVWVDKNIEDITKSDISELLASIAQGRSKGPDGRLLGTPTTAAATRAQLVTLFNWYVEQYGSDSFRSPIVKSKNTAQWKPAARERVLEDREIRALWQAAEGLGAYGAAVKCALLTAQRFHKVATMRRTDLKDSMRIQGRMADDGQWITDQDIGNIWDATRDNDPKNKRVSAVPLSQLARQVIAAAPVIEARRRADFVFSSNGHSPLGGWNHYKAQLDRKMLELLRQEAMQAGTDPDTVELKPWQHRDLRRTSRTMMARMNVSREVAEHCLAHVLPGVEKVYNRYNYLPQKREAFEKLAELVERIVAGPPRGNVVSILEATVG